ncbi:hypothetical protein [Neorhizobium sp. NCHU2750]|uniref:hypothetical protein n=1 Tax=Neorhizobium sp. NCHU2750 TaxID=1825976 RepID=UPI000E7370A6|nr:hypothetical protein NCHU2750_07190 [Neorhizobium sp. NCHU2750]
MTTAAIILYLLIAKIFFILTLVEGVLRNLPWSAARFSGLALSVAWPLLMLAVALCDRRHGKGTNGRPAS